MDWIPDELRTLRNIIQSAEDNVDISLLRRIIKSSVDAARALPLLSSLETKWNDAWSK